MKSMNDVSRMKADFVSCLNNSLWFMIQPLSFGQRYLSQSLKPKPAVINVPETKISFLKNGLCVASEDSGIPTTTVCSMHDSFVVVLLKSIGLYYIKFCL